MRGVRGIQASSTGHAVGEVASFATPASGAGPQMGQPQGSVQPRRGGGGGLNRRRFRTT
jgi:hypothetical protein